MPKTGRGLRPVILDKNDGGGGRTVWRYSVGRKCLTPTRKGPVKRKRHGGAPLQVAKPEELAAADSVEDFLFGGLSQSPPRGSPFCPPSSSPPPLTEEPPATPEPEEEDEVPLVPEDYGRPTCARISQVAELGLLGGHPWRSTNPTHASPQTGWGSLQGARGNATPDSLEWTQRLNPWGKSTEGLMFEINLNQPNVKFVSSQQRFSQLRSREAGSEVDCKELEMPLSCPFSKCRITIPVRGGKCEHQECIDLRSFSLYMHQSGEGRVPCPVLFCSQQLAWSSLVVDGLAFEILKSAQGEEASQRSFARIDMERETWSFQTRKPTCARRRNANNPAEVSVMAAKREEMNVGTPPEEGSPGPIRIRDSGEL